MINMNKKVWVVVVALGAVGGYAQAIAEERPMGFFVTSSGPGKGGDLGGLEGADAHCQKLAAAVGAGDRQWRAYLSTEEPGKRGIFARQRIGNGPWYNARGALIATNPTDLHLYNKTITLETALDEGMDGPGRRCGVVRTSAVDRRTTMLLLRMRFHIVNQAAAHLGVVFGVPAAWSALLPTAVQTAVQTVELTAARDASSE